MFSYTETDYANMVECALEGGDYSKGRHLYFTRYGMTPSLRTFKKAIKRGIGDWIPTRRREETSDGFEASSDENWKEDNYTVTIKHEEIVIKEEMVPNNEINNQIHEKLAKDFERIPIVYTTRLDDMMILKKDFTRLDVDDIMENVVLESKPKFKGLIGSNTQSNQYNHLINPYFKLVDNVRKFNELVNSSDISSSKNDNLVKCSEELNVVLVDCKAKPGSTYNVWFNGSTWLFSEKRQSTPTPSDDDGSSSEPIINLIVKRKMVETVNLKKRWQHCLVFNNKSSTTDLYFINRVTSANGYCHMDRLIKEYELPLNSIIMTNCCWFGREAGINAITGWPKNSKTSTDLFRTPHKCPLGGCRCCCREQPTSFNNAVASFKQVQSDYASTVDKTPIWLNYRLKKGCQDLGDGYINRALCYDKIKSSRDIDPPVDGKKTIPMTIQFANNYTKMIECYNIEQDGNIKKLIEVKTGDLSVFSRFHQEKLCQNDDELCCWLKRDWLLWVMQPKYPNTVLNFMRTSHDCPNRKPGVGCETCCCKPSKSTLSFSRPQALKYESSSMYEHAKNYCNKTLLHRKKLSKYTKISKHKRENVFVKKHYAEKVETTLYNNVKVTHGPAPKPTKPSHWDHSQKKTTPGLKKTSTTNQTTSPSTSKRYSGVDPTIKLRTYKKKSLPTPPVENNIAPNPTAPAALPENPVQTPKVMVDLENQDPTVNSLVQSILNRFSDVRLTVSPEGDVSAELNTPMHELSTAELKILAAILKHAKEQVKSLKTNPGMLSASSVMNMFSNPINTTNVSPLGPKPPVPVRIAPSSVTTNSLPVGSPTVCNAASTSLPEIQTTAGTSKQGPTLVVYPLTANVSRKTQTENPYQCYTNMTALKIKQYITSCKSFLNNKVSPGTPLINNVFSLNKISAPHAAPVNKKSDPTQAKVLYATQPGTTDKQRRPLKVHKQNDTTPISLGIKRSRPTILRAKKPRTDTNLLDESPVNIPQVSQPVIQPLSSSIPTESMICLVPPKPIIPLSHSSLHDLVTTPHVPPPLRPNMLRSKTMASKEGPVCPETMNLPTVGPAFSLKTNDVAMSEESATMDDESILGC